MGEIEVEGLVELMKDLNTLSNSSLSKAARKGAMSVSKEIAKVYKKTAPKESGLLRSSVRAVTSRNLEKGVYRAAAVVFKKKKVSQKRYEKLKGFKKWTLGKKNKKKNKIEYFSSAYYAHFLEHGFWHRGGKNKKGKTSFVKGYKTMENATKKIEPKADILVQNELEKELKKIGF
ncbi:hypothetical protein IO388_000244 [Campylobacter lari]|uniref:HK97 gp10 family phage protein n=1 Tax=Campylobacter lari TaxID=201 RepID=UPI0012846EC5|nr:HK97 gp10 family phage protein [Campylobacter lari]EAI4303632.1 hypothetical protein [Campylobacter lari]EAK0815888.1 hypothetical protein [Campylobacter lari]EDA0673015.1 hypothetical protein [Campylobacter lari]EGK7506690.1 hypothetical protein [Campylobacter lari]EGK8094959.1 hypothetical protein [Campylobacter lari]